MLPSSGQPRPVVLIIDDDDTILRALRVAMSRYFDIETCNSAVRGVTLVKTLRPQVVVLDVKMPEHDGFWVFQEIRKFDQHVPIIFNTAYQDAMSKDDVMASLKPFGYLPKSGNLSDFVHLISQAVDETTRLRQSL